MSAGSLSLSRHTPLASSAAAGAFALVLLTNSSHAQTVPAADAPASVINLATAAREPNTTLVGAHTANARHTKPRAVPDPDAIRPFHIHFPDEALADLKRRITATRWPERETVADPSQGVQFATMQKLARYWATEYDWRKCEARLNALPQFITEIDGLDIHFIHVRSKHKNALPLIITHGWPGSIIEQLKVIGPLTDPTAYGGKAEDAFDVVIPSLPGLLGIHTNMAATVPANISKALAFHESPPSDLSAEERNAWDQLADFYGKGLGYAVEMSNRPQTLYGIADSPVGLAAWMLDHDIRSYVMIARVFDGKTEGLTRDDVLDNITLYWLTNTAVSSARLYWDTEQISNGAGFFDVRGVKIPVAVSVFPDEIYAAPRSWAEKAYPRLIYFNKLDKGGHFAAWEQPELFASEMRAAFKSLRQ